MKINVNFKNYTIPAEYAKGASMQDSLLETQSNLFHFKFVRSRLIPNIWHLV